MSLLMKALEKAAKDRGEARGEPAPAAEPATASSPAAPATPAAPRSELTLEPIAHEAPAAARVEPAPRPTPAPRTPPAAHASPTRDPSPSASRERAQAQAAAMMQASAGGTSADGSAVGEYVRTHPIVIIVALAVLLTAGIGGYVYVQIFHPGLLRSQPQFTPSKAPPSPIAQAPAPAPAAPPVAAAPAEPLLSAPLLKEAANESAQAPSAPRAKPRSAPAATAPEEPARGGNIVISPGSTEPALNPLLVDAYAALQANQIDSARSLYQKTLAADPKSTDALLGLAAIALRQGNSAEATRLYLQILELQPRNALAQSGLIALLGRADPVAAETRLKQLIAREPSAFLYFTLGNLYADQSQWAQAQLAYFQAHHLESANPDYAYNLAVALEHVSQPKLALGFYQRAVQLAAAKGRSHFNPAQVQDRIGKLARQVE